MENAAYKTLHIDAHSSASLTFLYENALGRLLLKLMIRPFVSKIGGAYLKTPLSKGMIKRFIANNHIDMREYEETSFRCFNDFFKRKIKPAMRPLPTDEKALFAPCDSKLSAYRIAPDSSFLIKGFRYTLEGLLKDTVLAKEFSGGACLIFRLMPDDYHRYCYFDAGTILTYKKIPGVLHTVRPIALMKTDVLGENFREYAVLQTTHFQKAVQMEVGAMFVGRISNHKYSGAVERGEEKGTFEFGGSTIILLLKEGAADIDELLFENTANGLESYVKLGQRIGSAL
ncbi:phosphatidylserine decarboxylase [Christensenellaceae bacterium OttesenSCG-928-M15]|nr:phosphatidylserine decarboxylase [Christensenellaceae bacterium OttesenSCG-928-M15]